MKILVIGINKDIHTTKRIASELEKQGISYSFVKWGDLNFEGDSVKDKNKKLDFNEYDKFFVDIPGYVVTNRGRQEGKNYSIRLFNEYFWLIKLLAGCNKRLINGDFFLASPFYNKFSQAVLFEKEEIESIKTIHLSDNKYEKVLVAIKASSIEFPVVAKKSIGGMGLAVWKLKNREGLRKFVVDKRSENLIFQPFIKNDGDYRILVCGSKGLGIMRRTAQEKEWRNNFFLGGKIERHEDKKMLKFAENVCLKLGLEYAGVDVIKSRGKFLVVEVNIFACFEGFEEVYPEINVAGKIIELIKLQSKKG
jgi:glutathione synthase/RimK-type ligase-like ATP-grasp enzyme